MTFIEWTSRSISFDTNKINKYTSWKFLLRAIGAVVPALLLQKEKPEVGQRPRSRPVQRPRQPGASTDRRTCADLWGGTTTPRIPDKEQGMVKPPTYPGSGFFFFGDQSW